MKIQIRKVNGVPMARPKNPHDKYMYGHGALAQEYAQFEQSVTEHEALGFEEGEAEGVLVWQYYERETRRWYTSVNEHQRPKDYKRVRQIWRIIPTPEKVEVKEGDNWIRVEDRLPKIPDEWYLVSVKNKNKEDGIYLMDIAVFDSDGQWQKTNTWEKVTHWQPLPSSPTH